MRDYGNIILYRKQFSGHFNANKSFFFTIAYFKTKAQAM
jgi:hypothetical protein